MHNLLHRHLIEFLCLIYLLHGRHFDSFERQVAVGLYSRKSRTRLYTYSEVICIYQRECRDAMCDIDTQRPNHMRVSFFYCCCLSRCELILFTFCNVMAQSFGIVNSESLPACKMGRFPSLMTHVSTTVKGINSQGDKWWNALVQNNSRQMIDVLYSGTVVACRCISLIVCSRCRAAYFGNHIGLQEGVVAVGYHHQFVFPGSFLKF